MRFRIIDCNKFCRNNGVFYTKELENREFNIEAICNYDTKKEELLAMINFENGFEIMLWCKNDDSIFISNEKINSDWHFNDDYYYYDKINKEKSVYKNLLAPKWMTSDNKFLYEIYDDKKIALNKFKKNSL